MLYCSWFLGVEMSMEVFEFLVMEAHVVDHIGAGMYLYASQDNSQIYLEAHEAEGAANEGEHHDGDDLLACQVGPRDHQLHLVACPDFLLLVRQGVEPRGKKGVFKDTSMEEGT